LRNSVARRFHFVAGLLLITGAGWTQKTTTPAEEAPVSPQLTISFQRQTIRESDRIPVQMFLLNPSDKVLTETTLKWSIPSGFLSLYPEPCEKSLAEFQQAYPQGAKPSFIWDTIPSNSDARSVQTKEFCLVSSTANEDSFNLVFELQFAWIAKDGRKRHSMITLEKPIKSAFLGSDTLAGIPLGLVSFFVPGLLFWMLLDWWKTPWRVQGNVLGDKMIYSVLLSLLLVAMLAPIGPLKPYLDVTSGLSMVKVALLALVGAAGGFIAGGVDRSVRRYKAQRALHIDDPDLVLFKKLLRLNQGKVKPSTILRTKEGDQYRGSVGAQTATHTYLMGWYQIMRDPAQPEIDGALKTELGGLIELGDYCAALALAQKKQLKVAERDYIFKRAQNSDEESQSPAIVRLIKTKAEVDGVIDVQDKADASQPLVLG